MKILSKENLSNFYIYSLIIIAISGLSLRIAYVVSNTVQRFIDNFSEKYSFFSGAIWLAVLSLVVFTCYSEYREDNSEKNSFKLIAWSLVLIGLLIYLAFKYNK